jgi:dTDP-4-amino-4,6-dideoxygalactose transaminase
VIPIAKPLIGPEEEKAVSAVLKSGFIAEGEVVRDFETAFAKYIGVKHAVAVNSGTAALHVALIAAGVKSGDEVICPSFSFIATGNSILYCNAKPVFADVREDTFNVGVEDVEKKITKKTKAIMPVHLYGQPAEMKAITELCEDHNLALIEDACQAHGAEYDGKKVGSFGVGCFSFYPTKNMATGEGGMITTDDDSIAERARMIRSHGMKVRYHHDMLGFNYRMTNVAAAIGVEQLKKLDGFNKKRIENAEYLTKKLSGARDIATPVVKKNVKHVFHQYTIKVAGDGRDALIKKLTENGIGHGIYYPIAIHQQKLYKELGFKASLPITERLCGEVVSLPIHPAVSKEDLDKIANVISG